MIERFLFKTSNIARSSYVWNSLAGILNAAQSVILLIVIARTNGLYDAGLFSIGYAIANLTLTVGKYGMRPYQSTDIEEQHQFCDYFNSRIFTCIAMLLISMAYCVYGWLFANYSLEKVAVVFLLCVWKTIDAIEDVFHGDFQQKGRLDVAAKALSIRFFLGLLTYMLALYFTCDLILSTCCCCLASVIVFVLTTVFSEKQFSVIKGKVSIPSIKKLLALNFPLCAGAFFSIYIGNAPKYAIDAALSEELQACYNFIFMPVFVISLLASFIFNPVLTKLAKAQVENDFSLFKRMVSRQIIVIAGISGVVILGSYLIGIPVLSWLYDTDLSELRAELCILLVGGCFLGLVSFFAIVVTVLRKQKKLLWGYLVVAVLAKLLSPYFVQNFQILGASCIYMGMMFMLAVCFAFFLIYEIKVAFKE